MRTSATQARTFSVGATLAAAASLCACLPEHREVGPSLPQTPPVGAADPRAYHYEGNFYQVSQGGLLFAWFGCQSCHSDGASFAAGRWRYGGAVDQVYASIAEGRPGMPKYAVAGAEPIWQLTAYVRSLENVSAPMRRRQSLDQAGEPVGDTWAGPVR